MAHGDWMELKGMQDWMELKGLGRHCPGGYGSHPMAGLGQAGNGAVAQAQAQLEDVQRKRAEVARRMEALTAGNVAGALGPAPAALAGAPGPLAGLPKWAPLAGLAALYFFMRGRK